MSGLERPKWFDKLLDEEEPEGCIGCGAIAGCCEFYPHCPGSPDWKPGEEGPMGIHTDGL